MPTPLPPADLHRLETENSIIPATAKAFELCHVDTYEGRELMGQSGNEDDSGIMFHGFWPGDPSPRVRTLRRDNPSLEKNEAGVLKPKRKYLTEPGRGNKVSFGPGEALEVLTDTQLPIVVTEGPKKLCALWQLARHNSDTPRFLASAVSGVWNWKGTIGKVVNSNGKRVDEKGVIPDFDRIVWTGRDVVVIFDSDVATNKKVAAARQGLVDELRKRGARVGVVDLPVLDGLDKTGFDDFLAQRGPEAALDLISNSFHAYSPHPLHESNFRPIQVSELLAEVEEPTTWVLDEYLPTGSLALIAGKPKEGKTTLVYELAKNVASGLPFLGRATRPGGVLILAVEEHRRDVKQRLQNLGAEGLEGLFVHVGPLSPSSTFFSELLAFIRDHEIMLVVIDTLAAFWSIENENDASEMTRSVKPLLQLARDSNACVLLIHHARKSEGSHGDEIRGSGALFGLVDLALIMKRHAVDNQRLLQAQSRYPETPSELVLELRDSGYVALGDPASVGKAEKRKQLIHALPDDWEKAESIIKRAGLTRRAGYRLLTLLVEEAIALREGMGKKTDPYQFKRNSICAPPPPIGGETNSMKADSIHAAPGTPHTPCTNGIPPQKLEGPEVPVASTNGETKAVSEEVVNL